MLNYYIVELSILEARESEINALYDKLIKETKLLRADSERLTTGKMRLKLQFTMRVMYNFTFRRTLYTINCIVQLVPTTITTNPGMTRVSANL